MNTREEMYIFHGLKSISEQADMEQDHGISCGMYIALARVYDILVNMHCDLYTIEKKGAENGKDD